ncbi:hypothetical protein DV515_00016578 [Chloebia gouldiae]|uniref:Uncharacterized protein n=1 Tax=Chloebia gouldiae TaxID=44316 RepID=A0A3L8RRY8_CHLGU|nr:hypothetical protein DV515_00016578 [Chloebia gouldiae]
MDPAEQEEPGDPSADERQRLRDVRLPLRRVHLQGQTHQLHPATHALLPEEDGLGNPAQEAPLMPEKSWNSTDLDQKNPRIVLGTQPGNSGSCSSQTPPRIWGE